MIRDILREKIKGLVQGFLLWAQAHPRPVFWVLRNFAPVLKIKTFALVSRYEDVREVMTFDDVFGVTYAPKMQDMTGGANFFLGMNDSPEYTRDVSNMRLVVAREDVTERITPFVAAHAAEIVTAAQGRLDVVADLTQPVPALLLGDYFGIPGPTPKVIFDWASNIFNFLFIDLQNTPEVTSEALASAQALRDYLDALIADRKRQASRDDVLGRCLALQSSGTPGMDDVAIRNNLFGILVGMLPTTSKAASFALDVLLDRPGPLAEVREAARADDDARVAAYVFEALRFNPINPGLLRVTMSDHRVARGHLRSRLLPAGTTVFAATQSAMFDGRKVAAPRRFRADRASTDYMHFGAGMHTCFGEHINLAQIPHILKPLLRCYNLRRAGKGDGVLHMKGPFPDHMVVEFTPENL